MEIIGRDCTMSQIYWGEIHAHSEQSDGSGDYRNMFVHARECGNLDFAAAADHACYHTDNEWQWMQDIVNAHNVDHEFVTLIGRVLGGVERRLLRTKKATMFGFFSASLTTTRDAFALQQAQAQE